MLNVAHLGREIKALTTLLRATLKVQIEILL